MSRPGVGEWRKGKNPSPRDQGHETGKLRARWWADKSVSRSASVPTMCQVFVGVDRRGPGPLGYHSLVSLLATAIEHRKMGQLERLSAHHVLSRPKALPTGTPIYGFDLSTTLERWFSGHRGGAERLSNFPKATQLVRCRVRIGTLV